MKSPAEIIEKLASTSINKSHLKCHIKKKKKERKVMLL